MPRGKSDHCVRTDHRAKYTACCRHGVGHYRTLPEAIKIVNSHVQSTFETINVRDIKTNEVVYTSDARKAELEYSRWLEDAYGRKERGR